MNYKRYNIAVDNFGKLHAVESNNGYWVKAEDIATLEQVAGQLDALYSDSALRTFETQEHFIVDGKFFVGAWMKWRLDGCIKHPREYLPKGDEIK